MNDAAWWDARYRQHSGVFAGDPHPWLVTNLDVLPVGGRVLCLGDGEGRHPRFLHECGFAVTAVEWSSVAVERASRECPAVQHICADLVEWVETPAAEGRWDAIVWIWVVTADDDRVCRALADVPVLVHVGSATLQPADVLQQRWPFHALSFSSDDDELHALGRLNFSPSDTPSEAHFLPSRGPSPG